MTAQHPIKLALTTLSCLTMLACGGASETPRTATAMTADEPTASVGEIGCTLDATTEVGEGTFVSLEQGNDTTAAERRYEILSDGSVELSGYQSVDAQLALSRNEDDANALNDALFETGVLGVPEGCYGIATDDPDAMITEVALMHEGHIYRWAMVGDDGPLPLIRARDAINSYVLATAELQADEPVLPVADGSYTVDVVSTGGSEVSASPEAATAAFD